MIVCAAKNLPFVSRLGLDVVQELKEFGGILECGLFGNHGRRCVDVVGEIWWRIALRAEYTCFLLIQTLRPAALAYKMLARRDEDASISVSRLGVPVSCIADAEDW
jgi:hypothetical protein